MRNADEGHSHIVVESNRRIVTVNYSCVEKLLNACAAFAGL